MTITTFTCSDKKIIRDFRRGAVPFQPCTVQTVEGGRLIPAARLTAPGRLDLLNLVRISKNEGDLDTQTTIHAIYGRGRNRLFQIQFEILQPVQTSFKLIFEQNTPKMTRWIEMLTASDCLAVSFDGNLSKFVVFTLSSADLREILEKAESEAA